MEELSVVDDHHPHKWSVIAWHKIIFSEQQWSPETHSVAAVTKECHSPSSASVRDCY